MYTAGIVSRASVAQSVCTLQAYPSCVRDASPSAQNIARVLHGPTCEKLFTFVAHARFMSDRENLQDCGKRRLKLVYVRYRLAYVVIYVLNSTTNATRYSIQGFVRSATTSA